jgi:HEAT repeat protein
MRAELGKDIALLAALAAVGLGIGGGILWWRGQDAAPSTPPAEPARVELAKAVPEERPSSGADQTETPEEGRDRDYIPPPTDSPEIMGFVDRTERGVKRVPDDITTAIQRVETPQDVAAVVSVLMDTRDTDVARNEAANLLHRSDYRGLVDHLIEVLDNPKEDARFRGFCVQHIWRNAHAPESPDRDTAIARLRAAVNDRDRSVRREAVLALVRMGDKVGREAAVGWLSDDDAADMRDLAIHCVHDLGLRKHLPAIRRHLEDEREPVRIAAIVTLSDWGDEQSRPAFEAAAGSASTRLQRAGKLALRTLDRKKRPGDPREQSTAR